MPGDADFYGWRSCSTCQSAKRFLVQQGVDVRERDFFKHPFSQDELLALLDGRPPSEMFSWKSPRARALGLQEGLASEDELLSLMVSNPYLIRRPITVIGDERVIGFDQKRLKELLHVG
jgi:arsenate reductase